MKKIILFTCLFLLASCNGTRISHNPNSSSFASSDISNDNTSFSSSEKPSNESNENYDSFQKVNKVIVQETKVYISIDESKDPYKNINVSDFYENYKPATSYEDAYFRSKHYLLSGEYLKEDGSLPDNRDHPKDSNGKYYRHALARFDVNQDGEYVAYTINSLDGHDYKIFSCGIYVSMNDVAAYLYAFNNIPVNYNTGTGSKEKEEVVAQYGEFGRLNFGYYSGPSSSRFQYEPYLEGQDDKTIYYREIDYGATTGSNQYIKGTSISRNTFRFLLGYATNSSYTTQTTMQNRHVYYTHNHYNDFSEYLNYYNGFGKTFGNVTAGNKINQYNPSNPPTQREDTTLAVGLTSLEVF